MKCQILFSGKNKKNISKCHLLKILPRVLSVKGVYFYTRHCPIVSEDKHTNSLQIVCK